MRSSKPRIIRLVVDVVYETERNQQIGRMTTFRGQNAEEVFDAVRNWIKSHERIESEEALLTKKLVGRKYKIPRKTKKTTTV